jgi:3-dehydroquinate dehydratase-1
MIAPNIVKATTQPRYVGVLFSANDLNRALRLRIPPDFFELRLDGLVRSVSKLPDVIPRLRRPIIITARSPNEGGLHNLPLSRRRQLLSRFLPRAAMIDVELSAATALASIIELAHASKVPVILSRHEFKRMPSLAVLRNLAERAHSLGANIFKIVARTDDRQQLENLINFAQSKNVPLCVSAMGVGRLGRVSRAILANSGSVLNYAHVGCASVEGQMSLSELRAAISRKRRSGKSRGTRRAYI